MGAKGWQDKVYNREEWKKILKTAGIVAFCKCQSNEWILVTHRIWILVIWLHTEVILELCKIGNPANSELHQVTST
jgi:hypothetical protein